MHEISYLARLLKHLQKTRLPIYKVQELTKIRLYSHMGIYLQTAENKSTSSNVYMKHGDTIPIGAIIYTYTCTVHTCIWPMCSDCTLLSDGIFFFSGICNTALRFHITFLMTQTLAFLFTLQCTHAILAYSVLRAFWYLLTWYVAVAIKTYTIYHTVLILYTC